MEEYNNDSKMKMIADEINRFEEELGLPCSSEIDPHITNRMCIVSQPFVIGTNTFSQAQQKILQINHTGEDVPGINPSMFVPNQVLHRPQDPLVTSSTNSVTCGLPFSPRKTASFNQPIPPPPPPPPMISQQQPPNFGPLMIRPDAMPRAPVIPSSSVTTFPRRTPTPWVPRPNYRPPVINSTDKNTKIESDLKADGSPKVVLSATPKLYTAKSDITEDFFDNINIGTTPMVVEPPKPSYMDFSKSNMKKFKSIETNKYNAPSNYSGGADSSTNKKKEKKPKKFIRVSGGQTWEDPTLTEWEDGDFRLFCGDLGNDVTDELLTRIFSRYPSFLKARVIRDKRTNKTKGFGFISFKDPQDFIKASKEMNGRYVGSRPIKLRKSSWKNRNLDTVKKKEKEKAALIALLTGK